MNVLLFGATGMVGDGVLHDCLTDPRVKSVLAVGRSPLGIPHPKLHERRRTGIEKITAFAHLIHACR